MGNVFYFDWEINFMAWLQNVLGENAIGVLSKFSALGETTLMVAVLGFMYWCLDKKKGVHLGLMIFGSNITFPIIKNICLRRRPYMDTDKVKLYRLIDKNADPMDILAQGYSFPSGHSATAASVYGGVAKISAPKKGEKVLNVIAIVLPLLVAFSRMVVGAHFPTDVIVGLVIGYAWVFLISWLSAKLKQWICIAIILAIGIPGIFICKSNDFFTAYGMLIGLCAAIPFEKKFVNFENTRNVLRGILRILFGGGFYFGLNEVLKLPFNKAFLNSGTTLALLTRAGRYAIILFFLAAIYPMAFKFTAKIGKKKYESNI